MAQADSVCLFNRFAAWNWFCCIIEGNTHQRPKCAWWYFGGYRWKHTAAANLQQCTIRMLTAFNQGWYFSAHTWKMFFSPSCVSTCLTAKSVFMLLVVSLTSQIKPIFRSFYHGLQLDDETEIPHDKADLDVLIGAQWPLITWSCALQDDWVKLVANSQKQTN